MDTNKITPRRPLVELMREICDRGRAILDDKDILFYFELPAMVNTFGTVYSTQFGGVTVKMGTVEYHHFGMVKVTVEDSEGQECVTIMSENPASIFKVLFF